MSAPASRRREPAPSAGEAGSGAVASLLRPASVAILGASDRSRWSQTAFENLTQGGFAGEVFLVNRRGGQVHGRASAESCVALGAKVDLGIVLVPGEGVRDAIRDLAAAGARSALVLTSGFAETGAAGLALQDDLVREAKIHGIRLLGPNCLGFINFVDRAYVWTTPVREALPGGKVAIVSQSGATALFLSNLAHQQGVGLTYVVSTGNEADFDSSAFIEFLVEDPSTHAIAAFVETIRHPDRFIRVAERALLRGKPIVVLKVGESEVTARAAQAHTGSLVGDDRVFDGICRQLGLIRVGSVEDLLATADIVSRTGVLGAGGLAVMSNSGGICEIASDTAHRHGVPLPELSDAASGKIRTALPGYATPHNPLDATGGVEPARCEDVIRALDEEERYAAILCPWYEIPTAPDQMSVRLTELHRHLSKGLNEASVPGMLVSYTNAVVNEFSRRIIAENAAPYLACGLDRAIGGIGRAMRWSDRQRSWTGRAEAGDAPHGRPARPTSEREALDYLSGAGVAVVPATLATSAGEAVAVARAMAGPVVLKIASPDIAHKSDIGGVALNLSGDDAVAEAFARIMAAAAAGAPTARIDGVLVAPMRERGLELLVGCTRDPQWGPVLAVGLGGVWVEILQDVALRRLPVDAAEIRRMLEELRGAKLLAGQRGIPAADLDAVADVIARIGEAALSLGPDLETFEVNPLWVRGDRVEALDALAVWADPGVAPAPRH